MINQINASKLYEMQENHPSANDSEEPGGWALIRSRNFRRGFQFGDKSTGVNDALQDGSQSPPQVTRKCSRGEDVALLGLPDPAGTKAQDLFPE